MRSLRSARLAPAPLRRLSIALLTALTAALLVSGVALAQEESEAPNCANGVVIPDPENNPELVADCEALLEAAPVLIGEEGSEAINWSDDIPILEWTGVLASSGRVTALDLSFMRLSGQLSPRLAELSQLTLISVRYNDLSGPIPTKFARLTNLAWLLLHGNQLTGEIPPELGQLTQLLRMDLDQNQLTGEIPAELGALSNLLEFWLDANLLTGSIPPALGGLSQIRHLSVTGNGLRGPVPSELGALSNLQSFWASGNNLSGCVVPGLEGSLRDQERVGAPWCAESNLATGAPAIVGTANAGDQLSAAVGAIAGPEGAPQPSAVSWQWQRCDRNGGECADLEATDQQYVVVEADAGATLRVLASFSDADGTAHGPLASAARLAPLPRNVETTWQQPDPLRASELFRTESGLLGVLRLEGERWLRYALFGGGQAVPGSVDFSIALGDTIWLAD